MALKKEEIERISNRLAKRGLSGGRGYAEALKLAVLNEILLAVSAVGGAASELKASLSAIDSSIGDLDLRLQAIESIMREK